MTTSNNNKKNKKKKIILSIIKIILILLIVICTYRIISVKSVHVNVEKKMTNTYNYLKENNRLNTNSYDKYIELDGDNIDKDLIDVVKFNLSLLPETLTHSFFEENNGKIIITDKDIQSTYYKGEVTGRMTGLYNSHNKNLHLYADKKDINYSLLHEFGHVLDDLTGWTSVKSEDFKDTYITDKDDFKTDDLDGHYLSNEKEYLAQAFMEYILDKETLIDNTPLTYIHVDGLLSNFNAEPHDDCSLHNIK